MEPLTAEFVLTLDPCWDLDQINAYLAGRSSVTLREVLLDTSGKIPKSHQGWLAWRLMTEDQRILWDTHILERVLPKFIGKSGMPEWDTWAENWVNGSDRSKETIRKCYDLCCAKYAGGSFALTLALALALCPLALALGALALALRDFYGEEAVLEEHDAQMLDALEILGVA
jgi:hypothetical protein